MSTTNLTPSPNLIGSVKVQPTSVQPGQPVLVEVCDVSGNPISDPTITVIIQGVPGNSRYFQFPAAGTITLSISAAQGKITQTAQATVTVAGAPLAFRTSLAAPVVREMPIIQISSIPGRPYAAAFSLGNPSSVRGSLASTVNKSNATNIAAASTVKSVAGVASVLPPAKVILSRNLLTAARACY